MISNSDHTELKTSPSGWSSWMKQAVEDDCFHAVSPMDLVAKSFVRMPSTKCNSVYQLKAMDNCLKNNNPIPPEENWSTRDVAKTLNLNNNATDDSKESFRAQLKETQRSSGH